MKVKNYLREVLQQLGIRTLTPSDKTLSEKLGGMSLIRFNKLVKNEGRPITVGEVQLLTEWLSGLTGQPKASFNLLEAAEAVTA